ncbi:hypothetical protein [Haloarcula marismortui]|uniref:Uncharacterized protein n=1 Tax=Haloarcula marismortui ATCC 33800 TaxID=662476 RepID=M0JM63_9EURY|nr:hypothetical protein [Haloarcula sinaiiensis]EMA10242.1 hypothetical protein C436_18211 [Haloarcula sinaiiensis ATCC 33800]QUJ74996.1 hypothetical protein KDQ40_22370 [Haloarcula sinaiiensis ATCC 33800]
MVTADARGPNRSDIASSDTAQWRLRYHVGDLEHYTEWTADFPTIENYYDQYHHGDHAHDVAIERRAVIET